MIVLDDVVTLCKSIQTLNFYLIDCSDKVPTLSPVRLFFQDIKMSLKEDIRAALLPIGPKYEEMLLEALKKTVNELKVSK